jgi:hypothetical protein
MDWLEIAQQVVNVCIIPLLGVATAYFIRWIKAKEEEVLLKVENDIADKYIMMVAQTITDCVIATN